MEKALNLNRKDLKDLEEDIRLNRKQRMEFIDMYAEWLKKTPNKEWSRQQNMIINSGFRSRKKKGFAETRLLNHIK
jgi:hypothetical protein